MGIHDKQEDDALGLYIGQASTAELQAMTESLRIELKAAQAKLDQAELIDPLTELPNRRALERALIRDLARADRDHTWLSFVLVDLDQFDHFNREHGREVGDNVLSMLGRVLPHFLRTTDLPARYGGAEFACILPNTPPEGAKVVADRIRSGIESTPMLSSAGVLHVTASVGVASVSGPGCRDALPALVDSASQSLLAAKREGGRGVVMTSLPPPRQEP